MAKNLNVLAYFKLQKLYDFVLCPYAEFDYYLSKIANHADVVKVLR